MIKLLTMKSEKGLYIANNNTSYSGRDSLPTKLTFNTDGVLTETFHKSWSFLEGHFEIVRVQRLGYAVQGNHRWELIDKELGLDIPEVLTPDEVGEFYDDDYGCCFSEESEYYKYRNLYERKSDLIPPELEEEEFEVHDGGFVSVNEVDNFSDMKIVKGVRKDSYTNYESVQLIENLSSIVNYSELEKILVPELALHNRPCSINADTAYKIIRHYVQDNIDPKEAVISSDYDFCFTVQKKIAIKPYEVVHEKTKSNGKSYARPRISKNKIEHKKVIVFEMCPAKKYDKYTPISGFYGESLADITENIKLFLDELMTAINTPLSECPHCNGTGHSEVKKIVHSKEEK